MVEVAVAHVADAIAIGVELCGVGYGRAVVVAVGHVSPGARVVLTEAIAIAVVRIPVAVTVHRHRVQPGVEGHHRAIGRPLQDERYHADVVRVRVLRLG